MRHPRIVLDTNVLCSGLRSRRGASFQLLSLLGTERFEIALSVPLVLEYETVLSRQITDLSAEQISDLLDYLCSVAHQQQIFFLWRPTLSDPKDEQVLELAVAAQCDGIVTFNRKDFRAAENFGLWVLEPRQFLQAIGEKAP